MILFGGTCLLVGVGGLGGFEGDGGRGGYVGEATIFKSSKSTMMEMFSFFWGVLLITFSL